MESEAYQEYFKRMRNKLSLAMWILINNNIIHETGYIVFTLFEFTFHLLAILCLY